MRAINKLKYIEVGYVEKEIEGDDLNRIRAAKIFYKSKYVVAGDSRDVMSVNMVEF